MADGMFVLPVARPLALPCDAADALIKESNAEAALLYIYIVRAGGRLSVPEAASALGRSVSEIKSAFDALAAMGLVKNGGAAQAPEVKLEKDEPPEYTARDLALAMNGQSSFAPMVAEVQRIMGSVLSANELMMLLGMYDYLGLPPEVIVLLVSRCVREYKEKFGEGRVPTMRTIEKKGYVWAREELFTLELAEKYLKREEEYHSAEAKLKRAFGIDGRNLSPTEARYARSWHDMGFEQEAVMLAYDITTANTGKLSWAYMNTILTSWHQKGLHKAGDIREKTGKGGKTKTSAGASGRAVPDEAELSRLRNELRRENKAKDGGAK